MKELNKTVKKIIDFIENNLENEIRLEEIAAYTGYSRFHLNRIFTEETGCTIHKYIQTRRLTIAAKKLGETDTPIAQIAQEAGYRSQQAFTLAFKQAYLKPPKAYRNTQAFASSQSKLTLAYTAPSRAHSNRLRHTRKISTITARIEVIAA